MWREKLMSRFLFISILLFIYACGGGGSSISTGTTDTSENNSTLLPGSVNSFQPLDIDD